MKSLKNIGSPKKIGMVSAFLVASAPASTVAQCTGPAISGTELATYIRGKLICAYKPNNTNGGNASERWSSYHDGTGTQTPANLWEYARGANDAVDPTKLVGTWVFIRVTPGTGDRTIAPNDNQADLVQYEYGANTYVWEVREITSGSPEPYEFCDPDTNDRIAYAKNPVSGVTPGTTTGNACIWPNF